MMGVSEWPGVESMVNGQQSFSRDIQTLFENGATGELTDRQLIERFKARENESAELAFTVLVERHGPMVFHACRSILRDRHAAEDAFQATFLILSRKAGSLYLRDSVGPWLFGTACRVARCARTAAFRRRAHEQKAAELTAPTVDDPSWDDRDAVLREELFRLPERYRLAVMMCDLYGLTQEQAARQLGWPSGTVRSRLARGRGRLRDQLTRRGLAPNAVPIGTSLARRGVPAALAASTVENALSFAAGRAAMGIATSSAIAFTEGVVTVMLMSKLKLILAVVLAGGVLVGSTTLLGHRALGLLQLAPAQVKPEPKNQAGTQVLPDAPALSGGEARSPIQNARLDVAKKMRDNMYRLYQGGTLNELAYRNAERRYNDLVGALTAKSDVDRARFQQARLDGLKQVEQIVRKQHADGQISENDMLTIVLERLEAEDDLAKAIARLSAVADTSKERLRVAKRIRDANYKRFSGGMMGPEEYLVWQKRYDDLAYAVMLTTGGDRIRLYEGRVAELREIEMRIKTLYDQGQVQESDVDIVAYYRLEAEEALAIAKAEKGEGPLRPMNIK
jgi:RNA polymerase sigma factor (sigma-70 family)